MSTEMLLWMMLLAPPTFVTAVLSVGVGCEVIDSKKRKKIRDERRIMVDLNKKIDVYEEEMKVYIEAEDLGLKMREINIMVYEIEEILKKEEFELEEKRVKYLNEQIAESKKVIKKFTELNEEEKKIIKATVNEIIDVVEKEVSEVCWKLKGRKHENLRKKYKEKLEQIKNIKKD